MLRKITVCCGVLVGLLSVNPAVAALSLQTSLNVSGTYTDNLFFSNEDAEEDFGTFFGPDVTLLFENPDIVIGATYSGRVALYVNNSDVNRYNQNANVILDLPFLTKQYQGLSVTVDESMSFTPQLDAFSLSEAENASNVPRVQREGSTGGTTGTGTGGAGVGGSGGRSAGLGGSGGTQGLFTRRSSAFINRAGLRLGYTWSSRFDTTLVYSNQYRHFFSKGFQDSLAHGGTLLAPYQATRYTTITPSYSYRQTEFLGRSTGNTSADRIISHRAKMALTYAFTPTISCTISGGGAFVKQEGATEQIQLPGGGTQEREIDEKFIGSWVGSANLIKTFQRGTLSLSARQTIGTGGGLGAQATRTRTVTGLGSYLLTPRLNTFASGGWAINDSVDGNAFDSTTYRVQTGLGYSFNEWLFGNVSFSRIDQRSKGTVATDVVVNQAFLSLTAVADPWFFVR